MGDRWTSWTRYVRTELEPALTDPKIFWLAALDEHCWDVFCAQWLLVAWSAVVGEG